MRRLGIVLAFSLAAGSAWAQGKEPIALRDMGSFHVGGRVIEITGQPIKEIVFTPGGVPAKMDPNGKYQVEQMYVQYFLPQNRKGRLPLLMWHGGGRRAPIRSRRWSPWSRRWAAIATRWN